MGGCGEGCRGGGEGVVEVTCYCFAEDDSRNLSETVA
jgi:hypothetical protein